MTHRIVVIGDLHLGPNARQADRLAALDLVIAAGLAHSDLALWAIPGDIFHSRSSIDDRNELAPRLQQMADRAPIVLVSGNHDAPGDLQILARLRATHPILVADRPGILTAQLATGVDAAIAAIPYPSRAGLVSAGAASGSLEQTGSQALEVMVMGLAAALDEAAAAGRLPLVLGHVNIAGARASSGQPQIGQEIELSEAALQRFPENAYCAFSHIHRHQQVGRGIYTGSICRLDYGEVEPKGYIEVEYVKVGSTWMHQWHFIELPVAPLYHVEGSLARDGFTFVCTTGIGGDVVDTPATWKGSEVRVRYRFKKAEAGVLDVAQIHATFAEVKSLKLDPVPVLEHNVRAPEIAAAQTLEQKVQAYCELQGIRWTPGLAHKLAALQSQDPAVVLAGVTGAGSDPQAPNAATNQQPELAEVRS